MKNRVVEIDDNVVALEIIYIGSKYGFIILYLRNLILKML